MRIGHMKLLHKKKENLYTQETPLITNESGLRKTNNENLAIRLKNLSKSYRTAHGKKVVLDDISFDFPRDKNIGILGRNGSGKSTLLSIIFGRTFADSGSIEFGDITISWPIGGACLNALLTARDNVKFVCRIYNVDINYGIDFVQHFTELGPYFDMPVKTFSSGMKAKLVFAMSAMIEFDCYLVDEGFNTGDTRLTQKMHERFMGDERRANMIIVSHNAKIIRKFCDTAAILHNGKLEYFENVNKAIQKYKKL